MKPFVQLQTTMAKPSGKNPLAGAIDIAILNAERYGTKLIIRNNSGRMEKVTPAEMRRRLDASRNQQTNG